MSNSTITNLDFEKLKVLIWKEIMKESSSYNLQKVCVEQKKIFKFPTYHDAFMLTISCQYKPMPVNYDSLKKLSEFFGTDKIDIYGEESHPGCETCDLGSSYTVVLSIFNSNLKIKKYKKISYRKKKG